MTAQSPHQSFGIVPLRKNQGRWEVLVVHRLEGFWEFPKGHAEGDEDSFTAACRELKEEAGLDVVRLLDPEPYVFSYQFLVHGKLVDKTVYYYVAEVQGDVVIQEAEVKGSRWVAWKEVKNVLTYDNLKELVEEIRF